ncbi:MAG: ATP-binding protein [Pseudomonadota bacterium]
MVDTTHAIISLLRRSFRSTIALEVDMAPDAASGGYLVTLDRAMLDHAILNIAINARDALGSAGTITFRLRRTGASSTDGRRVSLEISDTGAGMTPDVLKRAKDPYFSTKKIEQGSGIGLSVVQEFVEQSQGTLELDSAPGFGTTVKLTFRENETTCAGETTVPLTEVAQGAGETILIVEDEPHVRALMQSMLVRLGYKPISATSGTEAWSMIESGLDVAAVVSDVDLPGGITGTELGQRLQAWDARIPMMIVSGYDLSSVEAVPWHSPRRLHQKPISLAILSTALRDLLDEARD